MKTQHGMTNFIKGRIQSFKYALRGFYLLITSEHSIIAHALIFSVLVLAGFYVGITNQDWINQTLGMSFVPGIEGLNTSLEKLADFTHIEQHPKIAFIKDVAAGAVTFASFSFLIIILITYCPYFLNYV